MTRATRVTAVLTFAAVLASSVACGTPTSHGIATRPALPVPRPQPPGMIPASELNDEPPPPKCTSDKPFDPLAVSLHPPNPMPTPGNMPSGTPMERILKKGELVAGVDQNLHLFSAPNPHTGQLEGFDIEIIREIAEEIFGDRDKVRFRPVNFQHQLRYFEQW